MSVVCREVQGEGVTWHMMWESGEVPRGIKSLEGCKLLRQEYVVAVYIEPSHIEDLDTLRCSAIGELLEGTFW